MGGRPDRKDDEMVLKWLWHRVVDRWTSPQIAARYGVTDTRVRTSIQRVREADRIESGEDVEGAYW